MTRRTFVFVFAALAACSDPPTPPFGGDDSWKSTTSGTVTVEYKSVDEGLSSAILAAANQGKTASEAFFGKSIDGPFTARIFPDRPTLTAFWQVDWNQPSLVPQCWMIASANNTVIALLSPQRWAADACGHDGTNQSYVSAVIRHEVIHILHRRNNPSPTFVAQNDLWWFVEGVAVFGSGQHDDASKQRVRSLVSGGFSPESPQAALNGTSGYDVVGSIVRYIDSRFGRATLSSLLAARTEADLLGQLSLSREQLMSGWRDYVLGN